MANIINLSSCKYAAIVFKDIDPFFLSDYSALGSVLLGYYNARPVVNLIPGLDSVYVKQVMGYGYYESWSRFVIVFEFSDYTPVPDDLGIFKLWGRVLMVGQMIIGDRWSDIYDYICNVIDLKYGERVCYAGNWGWGNFYDLAVDFKGDFKRDWKHDEMVPYGLKVPGYDYGELDYIDINRLDI